MKQKCTKCGKELDENKIIWLTLSSKTGKYYIEITGMEVPEKENQGAFPFGKDCAKQEANLYRQPVPQA